MFLNLKLHNFIIRLTSNSLKFLFVILLAKTLTTTDYGLFVIFTTYIAIYTILSGLDFYTYATRKLIINAEENLEGTFVNYAFLILLSNIASVMVLNFLLNGKYTSWVVFLVCSIAIFESFVQEFSRLLIALEKQLLVSYLTLLRLLLPFCLFFVSNASEVISFIEGWLLSSFIAFSVGLTIVIRVIKIKEFKLNHVDYSWIKQGLKIASLFFFSTILSKLILGLDKVIISEFSSLEFLAAYGLFSAIAFGVYAFLDALVFSFSYQRLIKLQNTDDYFNMIIVVKNMTFHVLVFSILVTLTFFLFIDVVLNWLGKEAIIEYGNVFWVLNFSAMTFAFSMIPHYILYALGEDRQIMICQFLSFILFFTIISLGVVFKIDLTFLLPWALFCSFALLLFLKAYISYIKIKLKLL